VSMGQSDPLFTSFGTSGAWSLATWIFFRKRQHLLLLEILADSNPSAA
jgi:hypothetical protein